MSGILLWKCVMRTVAGPLSTKMSFTLEGPRSPSGALRARAVGVIWPSVGGKVFGFVEIPPAFQVQAECV